ncbi:MULTISPECIES: thiamine phosphate synthase [Kaistia]|uniref:Thiamine-phosphate synthase n=1 Tax=Kaistia nematophila TaxID=2994654 RepID=A0A9X3IMQ4_9HYPH|nr:thiamine phosphate synthase [Kaistia nematophila]MBN9060112.1 thiamine phosphate synthase [Hyphomicrobiales bacterium]MCX5570756.1 thiamine phosphate synthase [Kaistia nematophila]
MSRPFDLSLYLVTDEDLAGPRGVVETVRAAIDGGVTLVQHRFKQGSTRDFVATASALVDLLRPRGIPLIINDRVDVALAVDADGVHVGQSDMRVAKVRELIGPDRILGLSAAQMHELTPEELGPIDYLGVGPVFATSTKPNAPDPIGFEHLGRVKRTVGLPVVAIGGLKPEHVEPTLAAGADGLAIVSAIIAAEDPAAAARDFSTRIARYRGK